MHKCSVPAWQMSKLVHYPLSILEVWNGEGALVLTQSLSKSFKMFMMALIQCWGGINSYATDEEAWPKFVHCETCGCRDSHPSKIPKQSTILEGDDNSWDNYMQGWLGTWILYAWDGTCPNKQRTVHVMCMHMWLLTYTH